MRIKEKDKWKTAFSMPEDAFKLIVMFFVLINLLLTFQAIMNDLLRNIIEAGNILVFINDIMVEIETKKRHNNIIEEVLKRMVENNLFVKLEKYVSTF